MCLWGHFSDAAISSCMSLVYQAKYIVFFPIVLGHEIPERSYVCKHALPFSPNNVFTLGVLSLGVKAWYWFKVVSSVFSKFGDPYNARVPPSCVFVESLARNGVCGELSSGGLDLPTRRYVNFFWWKS